MIKNYYIEIIGLNEIGSILTCNSMNKYSDLMNILYCRHTFTIFRNDFRFFKARCNDNFKFTKWHLYIFINYLLSERYHDELRRIFRINQLCCKRMNYGKIFSPRVFDNVIIGMRDIWNEQNVPSTKSCCFITLMQPQTLEAEHYVNRTRKLSNRSNVVPRRPLIHVSWNPDNERYLFTRLMTITIITGLSGTAPHWKRPSLMHRCMPAKWRAESIDSPSIFNLNE